MMVTRARDLEETGRRWLGIQLDQRDLPALRGAAVQAEREFGGIDILFANAAARMVSGATFDVTAGDSAHNTA
ncbi:MAG TPA: hypothetical protein VMT45_09080 [Thermoanaerobaculaceae bacterium]|nr:hypothetical protein [Thermoanaerobaculaceae bacterium]